MMNRMSIAMLRGCAGIGALFCALSSVAAQDVLNGSGLVGRVHDGSGAAIAGARVAVRCGQQHVAEPVTDVQGEAHVVGLRPGRCFPALTAAGFRGVDREVLLTDGDTVDVEVTLAPETVNATVMVSA